jgi:hypothetical protein
VPEILLLVRSWLLTNAFARLFYALNLAASRRLCSFKVHEIDHKGGHLMSFFF